MPNGSRVSSVKLFGSRAVGSGSVEWLGTLQGVPEDNWTAASMMGGKLLVRSDQGWNLYDVMDPTMPLVLAQGIPSATEPAVAWPYVYGVRVSFSYEPFVQDFSRVDSPKYKAIEAPEVWSFVRVAPNILIGLGGNSMPNRIIDVSDPWNPRLQSVSAGNMMGCFAVSRNWLFVQDRNGVLGLPSPDEVAAFDLRQTNATGPVARFRTVYGSTMAISGSWLYVGMQPSGPTVVYDIGGVVEPGRAAASATVMGGYVVQVDLRRGGAGYTDPPRVRLVSTTGAGAELKSVLDGSGRVSSIQVVSPGAGYSADTRVEIESPDRVLRTATAVPRIVNGYVVEWDVTDPGRGYTTPPDIRLFDTSGGGSVSEAVLDVDGGVSAIRVLNPGSGYGAATRARIRPPVVPEHSLSLTPGHRLLSADGLSPTKAYEWQQLRVGGWQSIGWPILTNQSRSGRYLDGPDDGRPFRLAELPLPLTARATPSVVNGFVVDVVMEEGGTGYTVAPSVEFVGGGGSGATAIAVVEKGKVVGIVVDSPGRGYSQPPEIIVEPPPVRSVPVLVSEALRLDRRNQSLDLEYKLQASADLKEWHDHDGGGWQQAVQESETTYLQAVGGFRFFRLQRSPW